MNKSGQSSNGDGIKMAWNFSPAPRCYGLVYQWVQNSEEKNHSQPEIIYLSKLSIKYVNRIKIYSDVPNIKTYLLWTRSGIYQEKRIIKERGRSGI